MTFPHIIIIMMHLTTQLPSSTISGHELLPQRSTRINSRPNYLQDYHCDLFNHFSATTSLPYIPYPLLNFVSYDKLSDRHKCFSLSISSNPEPKTYKQASFQECWPHAMIFELPTLKDNNTWVLTHFLDGKTTIRCKQVYRIKYKADGSIKHYKARLLATSYTQQEGVDYFDTFSLVAKLTMVHALLAIVVASNWFLYQLDVNTAFLHGDLHEEVYMCSSSWFKSP